MSQQPHFPFVSAEAPPEQADALAGVLFGEGASGVEIRDDTTLIKGPGNGLVEVVASFDSTTAAEAAAKVLRLLQPDLSVRADVLIGDAWRDKYKEYFVPFALTDSIVVAPPWQAHEPSAGERVLQLDPGRAFGTGLHATTSLVAQRLEAARATLVGKPLLDVGTGSGILALVALLLGAERAVAIDNDPQVIGVAQENAERNGLAERLELSTQTLDALHGRFPLVVANIEARTLMGLASKLCQRVEPGGLLVLSGVLASEADDVVKRFREHASGSEIATFARMEGDDGWVAIQLRFPT